MYGPGWLKKKEDVCKHITDQKWCDELFHPRTVEYEPTSTVSVLMAKQNSIQQRLQRYSPVYHREEGRNKGEIFLDRIKSTPVFALWDPSNSSAACTTAAQMKTIESKV